jgi:flagellar basal-body rod protein FlgF
MDRALYVGMTGAIQTMRQQQANNNNLANASTTGFRAELLDSSQIAVDGYGFDSRINAQSLDSGWDSRMGPIQQTGRDLDIVLRPDTWLAVQTADGSTAYTRAGNLQIDSLGQLLDGSGHQVLSDSGPISVPPYTSFHLGADGTLTVIPQGSAPNAPAIVSRLQIVDAQPSDLERGQDGLMRAVTGVTLNPSVGATVTTGAVEGSNVNVVDSMVNMIQLVRQFELQTKVLHAADDNASQASTLVRMT